MPSALLTPETPLFIVMNVASGSGDAQRSRLQMQQILAGAKRKHQFFLVHDPKQLPALARQAADAAVTHDGAVIAAGGDGTINAVAGATLATERPFGIVPQGTFNYSSRAHAIPLDSGLATEALLTATLKPVQVGQVNERIFLVNASLGLYPQLLEDREQYTRQYGRYRSVALLSGLMTLARGHRLMTLEIEHDHQRETIRTPTLFVGNNALQLEQAGLPEADDVRHRRLAAVAVQSVSSPLELLALALQGAMGKLGEATQVRDFAFHRMQVSPASRRRGRRVKVATDGEIVWMKAPLEFRVAQHSLQLMVPPQEAAQQLPAA
jgi:diacylglycerol kinase family enzyme